MARPDDTDRFYAELWPHRAVVLRVAKLLTHSDVEAEDLAQDTMLKAFSGISRLAPGSNARAWLLTVLRHAHIDRVRSRPGNGEASLETLNIEPSAPQDTSPEDVSAWGDPHRAMADFSDREVIAALKRVPEEIRWTLLLVDVQGLDDGEAAGVLGIPVGTVKSRLHRGRRMLREYLMPLAIDRRLYPASKQKENSGR
jgi:RNA polymerase sigma-70 factor (ECF subfamily)